MSVLQKGIKAAEMLVSFQIIMKGVNFFFGVLIARMVSPEVYGTAQIQLNLITATILHLSRESFRKVALKTTSNPFGIMWLSVILTSLIGLVTCIVNPEASTLIIVSAALIEVLAEPYIISHLRSINVKSTIIAESVAAIINCLVIISFSEFGVIAFSLGQLSTSISNFLIHYMKSSKVELTLFISEEDKSLLKTFSIIGVFRYFLSQGERLFLTYMPYTLTDQGVYALISNLCWIIPGTFYAPVEKIAFIVFSKKLDKDELREGFQNIIGIMWVFGMISATYLQVFAEIIIQSFYGEKWEGTSAPRTLSIYGFYLLVMGVFGSSDSVDWALCNETQIARKRVPSAVSFFVFTVSAYLLSGYGADGLVISCILSSLCQLSYSVKSHLEHFDWFHISDMFPDLTSILTCFCAFSILRLAKMYTDETELFYLGVLVGVVHCYILFVLHQEKIKKIKLYKAG